MELNTEKLQLSEHFLDVAVANTRKKTLSECLHTGSVTGFDGYIITSSSLPCVVGSLCYIENDFGEKVTGEVVRIKESSVDIVPHDNAFAISVKDKVALVQVAQEVQVGDELLGRVIDGLGNPLDQLGSIECQTALSLNGSSLNPFERTPIEDILDVGIRNINATLTLGRGQRIGIIAGSSVGKSV